VTSTRVAVAAATRRILPSIASAKLVDSSFLVRLRGVSGFFEASSWLLLRYAAFF
jgi:hypothetical protein